MNYALVALIAMAGCMIQSACGIGYAMLVMALMPLFLPFKTVAVLEVITAFAFVLYIAIRLRKHITLKIILWPFLASTLTSVLGVAALSASSDAMLRRMLGIALLLVAVAFVCMERLGKVRPTPAAGLVAGAISGFSSGLFNIGGPPLAMYLLAVAKNKEEYNASIQCYFVFSTVYIFVMHILYGNVTREVLEYAVPAYAGVAVGTFLGLKIFRRLPADRIKQSVYALMAVIGIYLVIRG